MINRFSALILTIVIEYVVVWFFFRKNSLKLFGIVILINCFTHPLALYFFLNSFTNLWIIEMFVFLTEVVLIKLLLEIRYSRAMLISFTANLVTTLAGLLFSI